MKSSKKPGPAITAGVLIFFVALLAYPVIYIIGPGLLKGGYQVVYVPGLPLPPGRNIKTWGFEAQPVMINFDSRGKRAPRHLFGRALFVGPFVVFHLASGRD
jgi:hypothetical protein